LKIGEINVYVQKYDANGIHCLESVSYKHKEDNIKLFDFVTEIIWELSFFGTPVQRDTKSEDLDVMVDEIKKEYPKLEEEN
jgi:hypothetical protein